MVLQTELRAFTRIKDELLPVHEGKFVLIYGDDFFGVYDALETAYAEGLRRFGRVAFLVKKLTQQEPVYRNKAYFLGLNHARL